MATSKTEIRRWLEEAKSNGATHMIVVFDTWDYEDYPVFVKPGTDAREEMKRLAGGSMSRVMECYSLSMDTEIQLNEHRAWNFD